jgi:hypothetical protein
MICGVVSCCVQQEGGCHERMSYDRGMPSVTGLCGLFGLVSCLAKV